MPIGAEVLALSFDPLGWLYAKLQDVDPRLYLVALLLILALQLSTTVHAVLNKRDTRAVIGWVALMWLSPLFGSLLYIGLGINRIERKALSLQIRTQWRHARDYQLTEADRAQRDDVVPRYPGLAQLGLLTRQLTERTAAPGNAVQPLVDGDEAYPAMLAAIDGAQHSISLLTYIFDDDRAGQAFAERLAAAQRRGVQVRVLVDDVGSRYSKPTIIRRLRDAGLHAETFLPTRVPRLFKYANLRNHRKLLVVDGQIGFTGGTNIREGHWLELEPREPVQCLHFRFQGPVVSHLQEMFAVDWAFATGESLAGDLWFPEIERYGDVWARGIPDGPDEDLDKMPLAILGALAAAREQVHIVTPYFLPEPPIIQALNVAALRGVKVNILLPSKNNVRLVQWASFPILQEILGRGCRVYLSPPPFDHTKLFLIDDQWALVGSANWDPRSLRLNFEFNVECFSSELVGQLLQLVERKLEAASELTIDQITNRRLALRLRDGCARLASPYL